MKLEELSLTKSHYQIIESAFASFQGSVWSLDAPVFIFDRCWLRLDKIRFGQLEKRLPPDISQEAPELIRYNQLLEEGKDNILALQECWIEFGMEDFYRAIRGYWRCQEKGNNGWTFSRYIETLKKYRNSFDSCSISIPLIVLGRQNPSAEHSVEWIAKNGVDESLVISHSPSHRR